MRAASKAANLGSNPSRPVRTFSSFGRAPVFQTGGAGIVARNVLTLGRWSSLAL